MKRVIFLLVVGFASPVLAQPAPVQVPPVEFAASMSVDLHRRGTADLPGGIGAVFGADGNLTDHVAIATEVSTSPRMRAVMAGGRVTTRYYKEGPGGPGRFFAEALAGVHHDSRSDTGRATMQIGAGADVLVMRRGVSLHWALDYLFTPNASHDFAGARFAVGLVVGPYTKS